MKGAALAAVQKIMRHQDPRITTEVFGHLQTTYLKTPIERLSFGPEPEDRSGGGRPSHEADEQQSRLAAGDASEPPRPAASGVVLRLAAPFGTGAPRSGLTSGQFISCGSLCRRAGHSRASRCSRAHRLQ